MTDQLILILADIRKSDEPASRIDEDTDLLGDLGLDSVEITEFLLRVEETLHLAIDYARLERHHLRTIGSFSKYLGQMPRT